MGVAAVRSMSALSTKLFCEFRAFGESTIGVAVGMVVVVAGGLTRDQYGLYHAGRLSVYGSTVRSVSALGSNLTELVLGQIGEVGRVGRRHCM
jgi:hypothetical protein